ncbi:MAG TPA: hypothetical protein PLI74_10410, partial [Candidatus Kapabacteria bacterium]|nr:hypothetical protein [Candidatus Kapabacteria bacterium]
PSNGSTSQLDSIAWLIKGNKTTNPDKNFIGTINPVDLVFKTGNLERLRLTSQGDVNINSLTSGGMIKALPGSGTLVIATPGVNGDYETPLAFANGLTRNGQNVSLGGALTQNTDIDLSGSNLSFSGNGRIGIGTNTPSMTLEVVGTPGQPNVRMGSLAGTGQRIVGADATGALTTIDFAGGTVVGGSGTVNFVPKWTPNSTTLGNSQIYDDGVNIGIGTTSPTEYLSIGATSQFQINKTGAIVAATGVTSSGAITFSGLNAGGILKATPGTGTLAIATPGTDFEAPLTFTNGLTRTNNTVELGGSLSKATTIDIGANSLTLSTNGNTGNIVIGKFAQAGIVKNLDGGALVSGKVDLVNDVTGVLTPANGGTGRNSVGLPGTVAYSNGTILDYSAQGTTGQVLISNGTNAPTWSNASTLFTFENGITANGSVVGLGGNLNKTTQINIGTNDLILSAAGNTGNIVIGKFATPGIVKNDAAGVLSSGKVDLANDVTGTLLPANGGTGNTVVGSAGTVAFSDGTKIDYTNVGTQGQVLISEGSATPRWTKTLSEFTINQSTLNSPIIAGSTTVLGDISFNGPATFNDTAIFNKPPKFPLTKNYIYVGNSSNQAAPFAPGANGSLLSINQSGDVQWSTTLPSTINVPFNQITSGTNAGQTLTIGAGTVMEASNGGINRANEFVGSGSTTNAVDLNTSEVSGVLSVEKGGTGNTSVGPAGTVA